MRPKILWIVLAPTIAICVVIREARLARRLDSFAAERDRLAAQVKTTRTRLDETESKLQELHLQTESGSRIGQDFALQQALARVSALETRLQRLSGDVSRQRPRYPLVTEYDPTRPPPPDLQAEVATPTTLKRAWGPEQITGPPDTDRAGDIETAWARASSGSKISCRKRNRIYETQY